MNRLTGYLLVTAGMLLLAACSASPPPPSADTQAPKMSPSDRGKYLVTAMGCNDCHTPLKRGPAGPEPDMTRMLSGHPEGEKLGPAPKVSGGWGWVGAASNTAFAGPWGVSYTANLTPDQNTGLAVWTEDMFVTAMREGKHMGKSRPILPPMPWPAFKNLSDEDLKAIYAYLKTIPPVTNHVPDPVIAAEPPKAPIPGAARD
jgi:mono/diheme cytochrome c family protein